MIKTLRKKLSDAAHEFIGSWAYFAGSIMADAFQERLDEIHGEEGEECRVDGGPATEEKPN
jgi:hypothetical protein